MPPALANKIAAGEVVQRPASVAKELIENAIDAGASEITLILKAAGSELVQVVDNGCGMSPIDALLCFDRHATSKLVRIEDLDALRTLGFRGEALASIAAVAQVTLLTRRHEDEMGYRVSVEDAAVLASEPCAAQAGTSIAVRNLFYNVPARRSFLKTPATEFKHIVETFQFLALSHPGIAFTLVHDENEVYRLEACPGKAFHTALKARIAQLLGAQLGEQLIGIEETTSYLSARGLIGKPDYFRRSRGEQFLFVNDRYVKDRYLEHAIRSAYEDLIPEGAFPFFVVFLSMDPRHVDVNVHPTKAEVKFDDERGIYGFLRSVVRKGVGSAALSPQFDFDGAPAAGGSGLGGSAIAASWLTPATGRSSRGSSWSAPRSGGRDPYGPSSGALSERLFGGTHRTEPASLLIPSEPNRQNEAADEADLDGAPIWQLHQRYILTQIRSGLMIFDQTAAHERILYEKALQNLESGMALSQQLLFPHTLDFSPSDFELIKELLPDFRKLGFEVDLFSGRSVVVRGVPADIKVGDERKILEEILEQYKMNRDALKLQARENLAKSIARRGALRGGTRLDAKEMRSLIDQLFQCEMPYVCPYGRPTQVSLTMDELEARFNQGRPAS
ncbi:MAG: DNA mismatch repair endonuclease MutL [Rhodothermales bacterium]